MCRPDTLLRLEPNVMAVSVDDKHYVIEGLTEEGFKCREVINVEGFLYKNPKYPQPVEFTKIMAALNAGLLRRVDQIGGKLAPDMSEVEMWFVKAARLGERAELVHDWIKINQPERLETPVRLAA